MVQWWAVVFGSNLGGNITPIGSASTVVACTIMKIHDLKVSFLDFVKIGGTFTLSQFAARQSIKCFLARTASRAPIACSGAALS